MIKYKFYKREQELACEISEGSIVYFLNYQDAKRSLYKLSRREYNNIYADNYRVTFTTQNMQIVIEDFTNVLLDYIGYGGYNLICDIKKAMKRKTKAKKVVRLKRNTKSVICAAGVMTILLFGSKNVVFGAGLDTTEVVPIELDFEPIPQDTNNQTLPPVVQELEKAVDKIISDYNNDNSNTNLYSEVEIECPDNSNTDEVLYVEEQYGDIIKELSETYGISSNLITAMITQESHGLHDNVMQISFDAHKNEVKTLYNFATGKEEKFVITDNPSAYVSLGYQTYTLEDLKLPYNNIKCGVSILASYYQTYCKKNIMASLVCYNQGPAKMKKFVEQASVITLSRTDEILNSPSDLSYLDYMHKSNIGDPYYIEHVMQYVKDYEDGIYMLNMDENGPEENRICVEKSAIKTR